MYRLFGIQLIYHCDISTYIILSSRDCHFSFRFLMMNYTLRSIAILLACFSMRIIQGTLNDDTRAAVSLNAFVGSVLAQKCGIFTLKNVWVRYGGKILMIDDYGCWGGSKKAVDEYFGNERFKPFFHYIDYTGRSAVKI